eukprot:329721_1
MSGFRATAPSFDPCPSVSSFDHDQMSLYTEDSRSQYRLQSVHSVESSLFSEFEAPSSFNSYSGDHDQATKPLLDSELFELMAAVDILCDDATCSATESRWDNEEEPFPELKEMEQKDITDQYYLNELTKWKSTSNIKNKNRLSFYNKYTVNMLIAGYYRRSSRRSSRRNRKNIFIQR